MRLEKIKKPDILQAVQGVVDLRQRGARFWGICPLHSEKTPSFAVDTQRQRFKCFGCGESGDVIDFIRKLKGLSFREAVSLLRIPDGLCGSRNRVKIDPQEKRRLVLSEAFSRWIDSTIGWLSDEIWFANTIDSLITRQEHLEIPWLSEMYLDREVAEHKLSVLTGNDPSAKVELYRKELLCSMKG